MNKLCLIFLLVVLGIQTIDAQSYDILKYDWRAREDSLWGTLPAAEELRVFDSLWAMIDQHFAAFQNLNLDWDSVRSVFRPEVEQGVSRGRFAAILSQLALALREPHTRIGDPRVVDVTKGVPGVPILFGGGWGNDASFGAGLTPLNDSTDLVYKTIPAHPLGLVPGDIVLGYDGVPWKRLFRQLLAMQLPISYTSYWGGNDAAFTETWLQSAGHNWHLFDTIDVVKYASGDTEHLPTNLLEGKDLSLFCSEQLPVGGVTIVDSINARKDVSWGIVQGTNIGYIYSWSWLYDSYHFYDAMDSLTQIKKVDGLILDFRTNGGGYVSNADQGLSFLFPSEPPIIYLAQRGSLVDHFSMAPYTQFILYPDSTRYYDKPVAVLMGPNSVSANDFVATQLRNSPHVRFFGRSPASGYVSPAGGEIDSVCVFLYGWLNGYVLEDSVPHYLTRVQFPMDETTWLTPAGVARGEDDVAAAAIRWVQTVVGTQAGPIAQIPQLYVLGQNFPNPFNPSTTVRFSIPVRSRVRVTIFNLLGQQVAELANAEMDAGSYDKTWKANVSSGVYFYRMEAVSLKSPGRRFVEVKKMVFMK